MKDVEDSLAAAPAPTPARILVVDDDLLIRRLHSDILARAGYDVDAVEDGAAAWDALKAARYDLLVTDHIMPKLTGVELLKKVRAVGLSLPVILATGNPPGAELLAFLSAQSVVTLLKPYAAAQLLALVQERLRSTADAGERSTRPPPGARGLFIVPTASQRRQPA